MLPENIFFSSTPANDLLKFLDTKKYSKVIVLVDENTKQHCLPVFDGLFKEIIEVKSGEEQKNIETS